VKLPTGNGTSTVGGTARTRGLRPPWRPGQTGNPRGGAVALLNLARRIRRASGEGQELVDFYFAVMRGQPIAVPGRRNPLVPTLDHRMHAASWLADRGWGRAREGRAPRRELFECQRTPRLAMPAFARGPNRDPLDPGAGPRASSSSNDGASRALPALAAPAGPCRKPHIASGRRLSPLA
jgi:hypothetical protein